MTFGLIFFFFLIFFGIGQYAAPAAAKGIHDKEVDEFQLKVGPRKRHL